MDSISESKIRPITVLTKPLRQFLKIEAASGLLLLFAASIAIFFANSGFKSQYREFWDILLTVGIDKFSLSYPLWYWVNDGLMTIFFFLVGLEIKREIVAGELRELRQVVTPTAAAIGGAVVPAVIFLLFIGDGPGRAGWAVPMATDIAFVVGALAILGRRVPHGLKVFLLTLAIVDDIIAVMIIAIFYSSKIQLMWLVGSVAGLCLIVVMNRLGIRTVAGYIFIGGMIWLCTLNSGIHPTIAGVALGLLTPAMPFISRKKLSSDLHQALKTIDDESISDNAKCRDILDDVGFTTKESISPLERFESHVHPWAAFAIMPIFALANAGVEFSGSNLMSPVSLAIILALFIGKPVGILLSLFLVVKSRLGILPGGANWTALGGAGSLAGIGFTMSIFVATLGLSGGLLSQAKSGILIGSALSAVIGVALLVFGLRNKRD